MTLLGTLISSASIFGARPVHPMHSRGRTDGDRRRARIGYASPRLCEGCALLRISEHMGDGR